MVEDRFSPDILDDVLETPGLKSGGAFTSVGYYDHTDMIKMVVALSKHVDLPVDALVAAFGEHLFTKLVTKYPALVETCDNTLDFLETVDSTVHKEVLKLYPQAELPSFACERISPDSLIMRYQSKRPFSQLALGLMRGSANFFEEKLDISFETSENEQGYAAVFEINRLHD